MDKQSRRELIRDYKERKIAAGVYAVRCAATGEVWVGGSRNIDTQENATRFGLKTGGHANKPLVAAWRAHGDAAFSFEVIERIDTEEMTPLGVADEIKSRERHWRAALGAMKAVG
jgi:hypothetical protein